MAELKDFEQQALDILKKKMKEAAIEISSIALFPAIEKIVADSPNKVDDMLLGMGEGQLKDLLAKLMAKI